MTEKDNGPLDFEVKGLDLEVQWFPDKEPEPNAEQKKDAEPEVEQPGLLDRLQERLESIGQLETVAEGSSLLDRLQERREALDHEPEAPELDREIEAPAMDQVRADADRAARIEAIEMKAANIIAERGDTMPQPQEMERGHGFER